MKPDIELNSLALKTRKLFGEDSYSPIDIFAVVNGWKEKKITIVYYPLSERVSGMCTKVNEDIVIAINSATSYGRQRFTLAHELYHILYENDMKRIVCDMSMGEDKTDSEREADRFAGYLLMPYDALMQYAETKGSWSLEDVIEAEQFFQVSHQSMVLRLYLESYITKKQYDEYRNSRVSSTALRMGYGADLYKASSNQYYTVGEYIRKVEQLSVREVISEGKKEELLLDAFRADIVYNLEEEELND